MMDSVFSDIPKIFSVAYIFCNVIASYLIIKGIDFINGVKVVPTWVKRLITVCVGAVSFVIFKVYTDTELQTLLTSFFASVFIYDAAIKFLLDKFNISYKK